VRFDIFNLLPLFDLDLLICDELRGAYVNVVTTTSAEVFHEEAGAVRTTVDSKSGGSKATEEMTVTRHLFFCGCCSTRLAMGLGTDILSMSASSTGGWQGVGRDQRAS